MLNIMMSLLAICGIIILSTIAIFLLMVSFFIIFYSIKKVKEELNKK